MNLTEKRKSISRQAGGLTMMASLSPLGPHRSMKIRHTNQGRTSATILTGAMFIVVITLSGCARCASNGWAQTAPSIPPTSVSGPTSTGHATAWSPTAAPAKPTAAAMN